MESEGSGLARLGKAGRGKFRDARGTAAMTGHPRRTHPANIPPSAADEVAAVA